MTATNVIGTEFNYKGKPFIVRNVESNGIDAKPLNEPNSPLKLLLPLHIFNEITGLKVSAPETKVITAQDRTEQEIIRQAEQIRYQGGLNGRQYIDKYFADGYNKIISFKYGAVRKYYLDNSRTNLQLPISGALRKYAELLISKQDTTTI